MNTEVPFNPAIKRVHRKRKPFATSEAPPVSPLTVASVSDVAFDETQGSLVVTMDVNAGYSLLDPASADPAQWTVNYKRVAYVGTSFLFDGGASMTVFFQDNHSTHAADSLSYASDPSDIGDTQGRMLGAVEGFPI